MSHPKRYRAAEKLGFMSIFIPLIVVLFLLIMASGDSTSAEEVYRYPDIKPEIEIKTGYRFVGLSGDERASEYEHLEDSVPIWGRVAAFPFPHRVYLEIDALNTKDYFGDIRYAYKDIVLSRWLNRTYFHNLDNFRFSGTSDIQMDTASDKYNIKAGLNDFSLRIKAPHFPFHVYLNTRFINRDGSLQQRYLGGTAWWDAANVWKRASRAREVDWRSQDVTVGTNSHLGPIEIDISHTEKRFDSGSEYFLIDKYDAAIYTWGAAPYAIRPSGKYPHNLIPDTKGSETTLKVHTSYTGRVVGGISLSRGGRKNELNGTESSFLNGSAELIVMPVEKLTNLTMFFKFRHRDSDVDNPDTLDDGYYGLSSNPLPVTNIKQSVATESNTLSGDVRYRFKWEKIKEITLNLGYAVEKTGRENTAEWDYPDGTELNDKSTTNTISLSANAKLPWTLKLKTLLQYQNTDNPVYYIDPERSRQGLISLKWTPYKTFSALFSYKLVLENRDDISFGSLGTTDRDTTRNRLTGGLTFLIGKSLTFSSSYSYLYNKTSQTLFNCDPFVWPYTYISGESVYKDSARNIAASLNYNQRQNGKVLTRLAAELSRTTSEGVFVPAANLYNSAIEDTEITETVYALRGERWLKNGWGVGASHKYIDFENLTSNPDLSDGTVNITFITAMKRWH